MGFDAEFVIVGHRGAAGLAPENTLPAFRLAERLGVDAVELDIRLADSRLAVFHDATLERTTNGSGAINEKSWDEIQTLDAGGGERIPELAQVFGVLNSASGVNIELKGKSAGAALAEFLKSNSPPQPLLVSSFSIREIEAFQRAGGSAPIALLIAKFDERHAHRAIELGAWSAHLHDRLATPKRVAQLVDCGLRVFVYTVNNPARLRELRNIGAHGVFTDFPDRCAIKPLPETATAPSAHKVRCDG